MKKKPLLLPRSGHGRVRDQILDRISQLKTRQPTLATIVKNHTSAIEEAQNEFNGIILPLYDDWSTEFVTAVLSFLRSRIAQRLANFDITRSNLFEGTDFLSFVRQEGAEEEFERALGLGSGSGSALEPGRLIDRLVVTLNRGQRALDRLTKAARNEAISEIETLSDAVQANARALDLKQARLQLQALEFELASLRDLIALAVPLDDAEAVSESFQMTPSLPPTQGWIDVIVDNTNSQTSLNTSASYSSREGGWSVNSFFGGISQSQLAAFANSSIQFEASDFRVQIGARCTKVTINRRWLDTFLFRKLDQMISLDGSSLDQTLKSFPVCKDTTLRVFSNNIKVDEWRSFSSTSSSSVAGFFMFSAGGGAAQQSSLQNYYSAVTRDSMIVRIPSPQILGWIVQDVVNADVKFNDSDPLNLPESLGGRRKSSAGSPPEGETPKPEAEPGPSTSSTFMQIANNTLDPQLESFFTSTFSLLPFFDLPQSSSRLKASSFYKKVLVPFKEMYAGPKIQEFLQLPEIKALNLPTGDILDFKKHKARGASKKAQEALVAVRKTLAAAVMYLAINYATSPRKGGVAGICYVKAVGTSALTSDLDFNAFGPCAIPVALFVSYAFNVLFDDLAADGVCGVSGGPSCSAHVFDVNIYETGGFQYRLKSIAPSDPVITARLAAKYTEVYNKLLESGESTGDYDSFGFSVNYDASEDEKDYLPFSGFKSSSFNPWYQLEYTLLMFATLKAVTLKYEGGHVSPHSFRSLVEWPPLLQLTAPGSLFNADQLAQIRKIPTTQLGEELFSTGEPYALISDWIKKNLKSGFDNFEKYTLLNERISEQTIDAAYLSKLDNRIQTQIDKCFADVFAPESYLTSASFEFVVLKVQSRLDSVVLYPVEYLTAAMENVGWAEEHCYDAPVNNKYDTKGPLKYIQRTFDALARLARFESFKDVDLNTRMIAGNSAAPTKSFNDIKAIMDEWARKRSAGEDLAPQVQELVVYFRVEDPTATVSPSKCISAEGGISRPLTTEACAMLYLVQQTIVTCTDVIKHYLALLPAARFPEARRRL